VKHVSRVFASVIFAVSLNFTHANSKVFKDIPDIHLLRNADSFSIDCKNSNTDAIDHEALMWMPAR
jgi:hypothetical protein